MFTYLALWAWFTSSSRVLIKHLAHCWCSCSLLCSMRNFCIRCTQHRVSAHFKNEKKMCLGGAGGRVSSQIWQAIWHVRKHLHKQVNITHTSEKTQSYLHSLSCYHVQCLIQITQRWQKHQTNILTQQRNKNKSFLGRSSTMLLCHSGVSQLITTSMCACI